MPSVAKKITSLCENMDKSSVFEETYTNYLAQIGRLDFKKIADRLGAEMDGDDLIIPVFGKPMRVSNT